MLIDTHCHLDFPDFEAERDAIVARAHEAGVEQMITISTRVKRFETILSIAESRSGRLFWCPVGLRHDHPVWDTLPIRGRGSGPTVSPTQRPTHPVGRRRAESRRPLPH